MRRRVYGSLRASERARGGQSAGREERERSGGASLTAAASAYKDDGFVNYGAHGDGSSLRARCTPTHVALGHDRSWLPRKLPPLHPSPRVCSSSRAGVPRINTHTRRSRVPCKDRSLYGRAAEITSM